eukprot:gnl/TRDRNA2_/TRDRNA2_172256_c1_seq1.p1 gnl/TRDRNA2_/TRDRNA2_172256_c1~~gnl/TRDRNA2_/TRDRNA2_172256_c1_seq1.p1  ORF type:complete len:361 (+),score=64.18 gnl/TRDRNA2_/TRDRNA2_172256_c1_seq1:70-1083(+)
MAFVGTDATDEWVTIHKPGTIERFPNNAIILGPLAGGGGAAAAPVAAAPAEDPPPEGDGGIPGWFGALVFWIKAIVVLAAKTVFFTGNLKFNFDSDRRGTIRSAIFLIVFIIIHAVGNVHLFSGPRDFNGYGYMYDRLHWTGLGLDASIVEEYLLLALMLHVAVALKRSWEISMNYCLYTGKWNMLISGLLVLTFIINHLGDFRFNGAVTHQHLKAPPYYIDPSGITEWPPRLFWMPDDTPDVPFSKVRDIYTLEYELFKDPWKVAFYVGGITAFTLHLVLGWKKVVGADALQIPKDHVKKVTYLGWMLAAGICSIYVSFPLFTLLVDPEPIENALP